MDFKHLLFSFQGRLNRKPYVLGLIGMICIYLILEVVLGEETGDLLGILLLLWPSLALQVKRWHDIDKSGWWLLIHLVPLVNLYFSIVLLIRKGTEGNNRFGDNPLENNSGTSVNLEKSV